MSPAFKVLSQYFRRFILLTSCLWVIFTATVQAEDASLKGNVITVPVVVVGGQFFRYELTLVNGTNPIELGLTASEEVTGVSSVGASTLNGIPLTIPAIQVGDINYRVNLSLSSQTPVIFTLAGATVNVIDNSAEKREDALALFEENIAQNIIQLRWIVCHVEGGIARDTGFKYQRTNTASTLNNFAVFETFLDTREDARSYIMSKSSGTDHTGGVQLPVGGADYNNLDSFLAALSDSNEASAASPNSSGFFDSVILQSNTATLRRAAIMLAGRLPTDVEIAQVTNGDDDVLRSTLRGLMQGDGFHQFLLEGANDRLLTRGIVGEVVGCFDSQGCFPAYQNEVVANQVESLAAYGHIDTGFGLSQLITRTAYGMKESPLELIAHVVENELPYSEILTANYAMLNPVANSSMEGTAVFDNPDDMLEFKPGIIKGYYRPSQNQVFEELEFGSLRLLDFGELQIDIPHAGILSTSAFLLRYPTTATNRNRARARWTFYHFLGVDIAASAQRTTDPVALADTNNPTLNNSVCAVCHTTMDPVAGAFQNYSARGNYRTKDQGSRY